MRGERHDSEEARKRKCYDGRNNVLQKRRADSSGRGELNGRYPYSSTGKVGSGFFLPFRSACCT